MFTASMLAKFKSLQNLKKLLAIFHYTVTTLSSQVTDVLISNSVIYPRWGDFRNSTGCPDKLYLSLI